MKATYSLLDATAAELRIVAERASGGNVSLVVDAAVRLFVRTEPAQQAAIIARLNAERQATTRDGWMRVFWHWLAAEFKSKDLTANPNAPRTYRDCLVVFLLKSQNEYPGDNDPFQVHVWPTGNADQRLQRNFVFDRAASAVDAAEQVAQWIQSEY